MGSASAPALPIQSSEAIIGIKHLFQREWRTTLKNGWFMISPKPESLWQPRRSAGFLLRKPFRMEAAFTESDRGILMVFSRITLGTSMTRSYEKDISYLKQVVLCVLIRVVCGADNVKGRSSGKHLIQQHAKGPPVNRETVGFQKC